MNDREHCDVFFKTLGKVLLRSCILGIALLLLWFVFFLVGDDWAYGIHSKWFEITKHDFDLMNYYGMAFVKMIIFLLFLIPYLSIKMISRSTKDARQ